MKIAIVLPDLRGGGVERIRLSLAGEFRRLGHGVEFVLMQAQGELLSEAMASFAVHDLACRRIRQLPWALARYLRRYQPDALLVAMWPLTVVAPLASRLSGHPCDVLISEHNTLSAQYAAQGSLHLRLLRFSMALGYRLARSRVAVSEGVSRDLAALSGLERDRFTVIHNPVPCRPPPSREAMARATACWGIAGGQRIVSVGSFKPQKNHAMLLRAFARLERRNARLMLVGAGAEEDELRRLAVELDIGHKVIFAGFHADPTPFYLTADLFVLASDFEGFGNVIIEALACGTPVVSTNCPSGPAEILKHGEYGRLVPVGDDTAMADALADALASEHDTQRLKARATEFSPAIAASKHLDLLAK
ncbi:glycosyltransferase [Halomonas cerina]|uniref:Glycosyltransferase involved in cell wall biosynthesis n=1 Tax=Halomonas cerina TaxID=447424 RepID=A0A839V0E5_9GAMM|nr:glycosyltransferase involved in cell wall biosynthesis [Halomonas cerina]